MKIKTLLAAILALTLAVNAGQPEPLPKGHTPPLVSMERGNDGNVVLSFVCFGSWEVFSSEEVFGPYLPYVAGHGAHGLVQLNIPAVKAHEFFVVAVRGNSGR